MFLIDSFCTFLQASIVTVIHLVNAVVDTVNKEGTVISACALCLCFQVTMSLGYCAVAYSNVVRTSL